MKWFFIASTNEKEIYTSLMGIECDREDKKLQFRRDVGKREVWGAQASPFLIVVGTFLSPFFDTWRL